MDFMLFAVSVLVHLIYLADIKALGVLSLDQDGHVYTQSTGVQEWSMNAKFCISSKVRKKVVFLVLHF